MSTYHDCFRWVYKGGMRHVYSLVFWLKLARTSRKTFQNSGITLPFFTPMFRCSTATEKMMPYGLLYSFDGKRYLMEVVTANVL